jgi:ubiquinone/menaquinone biosynthesis C-methylase UbiE
MSLYGRHVLPVLTDLVMRNRVARAERARFVPRASGDVLEVGVGSGLNLPFYGPRVRRLYALDPSAELLRRARRAATRAPFPVTFLQESAEAVPLPDGAVSTAVMTWTLCTIPDPVRALREIRRVLRPDGRLVFVEHGRSGDPAVVRWQDRLTPLWRRIAGGCHLNRAIDALIEEAGFRIDELERGDARGPRIASHLYRGLARPRDVASLTPEPRQE